MSSIDNIQTITDSADKTKLLFDRYFTKEISYPSNQVDAVVGFFRKRGFDNQASISVSTVLLQQAKIDNVNVFTLLETLEGLDKVKLSNLVAAVLNANRSKISKLGYKAQVDTENNLEHRNIIY